MAAAGCCVVCGVGDVLPAVVANLLDYTYKPVMGDLPTLQLPQVTTATHHPSLACVAS